jgi:transposase
LAGAPKEQHNGCSKEQDMARRKFTKEFKVSAVQLVNQEGYSVPEAARSLGIDPTNVRGWVDKYGDEVPVGGDGSVQAELRRLRKENARLTMERETVPEPKASAFFAKEQM